MNKIKYYDCGCGCGILRVEANIFPPGEPFDNEYFVSIYQGSKNRFRIIDRLRICWNTLIHGQPYGDQIVLDKEDAKDLSKFIDETVELKE